ncbi:protein of unknown function [Paraburkholderia dioscoreae]|uniref:Uncharacterized protein n=1 Tax=Paraburkholderia dioscoreae TaxID=2604047 RepID=A0A5Q4ZEE4_9BURK|nr:protein of unknown function [Paraburkholderia dioscoreae]
MVMVCSHKRKNPSQKRRSGSGIEVLGQAMMLIAEARRRAEASALVDRFATARVLSFPVMDATLRSSVFVRASADPPTVRLLREAVPLTRRHHATARPSAR